MFSVSLFTTMQGAPYTTGGTGPGDGLHGRGTAIRFLTGTRDFLFLRVHLALPSKVKRPRRVSDRSPPYSAEVKNGWSYTSVLPYVSMAPGGFQCICNTAMMRYGVSFI
jgi:hypothetical protein